MDVRGWIKTQYVDKSGKPLANKKYIIYLLNGNSINGVSDDDGNIELENLKQGAYFIIFKD